MRSNIVHTDNSAKTFCYYQYVYKVNKTPQEMNEIENKYTYRYDRKNKRMIRIYDRKNKRMIRICDCDNYDNNNSEEPNPSQPKQKCCATEKGAPIWSPSKYDVKCCNKK